MAPSHTETYMPQLLAANLIAIPILFFATLAVLGPLPHLVLYLMVGWTIAAFTSVVAFGADRRFMEQFSNHERLAILAGNGAAALMLATITGLTFGAVPVG